MPSKIGTFPTPSFFGAHKFHEIVIPSPTPEELRTIVDSHFPILRGSAAEALVRLWDAVQKLESSVSMRDVGLRELEKFCVRVQNVLPSSFPAPDIDSSASFISIFPNPSLHKEILIEVSDVFFCAGTLTQ
jgi:midasin